MPFELSRKQRAEILLNAWTDGVGEFPRNGKNRLLSLAGNTSFEAVMQALKSCASKKQDPEAVFEHVTSCARVIARVDNAEAENRRRQRKATKGLDRDLAHMRAMPLEHLLNWRAELVGTCFREKLRRLDLIISEKQARGTP